MNRRRQKCPKVSSAKSTHHISKQRGCQAATQLYHHPLPPSPTAPVFIAEHHYVVWNIPLFSVGLLPQLCPHPPSCPASAYTLGWWMGRVGGERETPKARGQQANSYFLSSIKEKGLVSLRTARVIAKLLHGYGCSYSMLSRMCKQNTKPNTQNPRNLS